MSDRQGDLFGGSGVAPPARVVPHAPAVDWALLDDAALSAALPGAGLATALAIVAEMERRRDAAAIPALEQLCRRFAGFGRTHVVPEQAAALDALVAIGGRDAADALARLIADAVIEGPGMRAAVAGAARLGSRLPAGPLVALLRHDDSALRAVACRCVRERAPPECIATLTDLLGDLHEDVRKAAACALGRMGRREGRDVLLALLRAAPSPEAIAAIAGIVEPDVIVALGRVAREGPASCVGAVIDALEGMDHPLAGQVAEGLRCRPGSA